MANKFIINNIKLLNSWSYNLPTNVDCTICRCNLNTNSLYNQEIGKKSLLVQGNCGHTFHQECIKPWLTNNNHCPICSGIWIAKKVYN